MKRVIIGALAGSLAAQAIGSPDAFKTIEVISHENNFQFESYTTVTADGYVLTIGRIPGKLTDQSVNKPVALFMHAQDCDMMEYVANEASVAPAFVLANLGYDVWLGNNRGSKFSNQHVEFEHHSKQYWDFYQEDMARQDLPTIIDYVLQKTSRANLTYIGHSEGTTQFFLGASLLPEYFTAKVNLFVALAPVASTANIPTPWLRESAKFVREIEFALMEANMYNLFPPMPDALIAEQFFCSLPWLKEVCKNFMGILHHEGVDSPEAGQTFLSNEPSGQSWRTFMYYAQMINSGKCALYDYGKRENKRIYGTEEPPLVPLENFAVPSALFSGSLDRLASPVDVAWTIQQIAPHVVFAQEYELDHFSFVVAKDMSYFTVDAVNVIQQFNPISATATLEFLQ